MSLGRGNKILLASLMVAVSTFLLYWCFRQIDLDLFWRDLFRINPLYLLAGLLAVFALILAYAAQWRVFIPIDRRPPYKKLLEAACITMMMANTVPWGHAVAVYLLGRLEKVSHTLALSVLTLDQLMGGVAKVFLYLTVAWLVPLPVWLGTAIRVFSAAVAVFYLVLLCFAFRHRDLGLQPVQRRHNLWNRLWRIVAEWAHHLHAIRNIREAAGGLAYALLMRVGEAAAIYVVQLGFGLDLPFWAPWLLVTAINLATMFPITPGNLGIFEATVFYIYIFPVSVCPFVNSSLGFPPGSVIFFVLSPLAPMQCLTAFVKHIA